ncbi:MAG: prolyl oligopeptidase family serine peptidase [Planctomycetes bacterium]|nr:prolyl oligopeptidase family serine peptidase [Planctomycetota bacterium]
MRRLLVFFSLLLCVPSAGRAGEEPRILADQVYGHKDGMALTLDVIRPAKPNGAGVLLIQSGGWYSNWVDAKGWLDRGKPYLDKGFTLFIVRHGSAPRYAVPDATADVRRSVRFIRLKAKDFGVNPERLGVFGGSAGGHLSLLLGTTGDNGDPKSKDEVLKASSRVAAVVALFPPTDLRDWTTNPPEAIKRIPALKPPLTFDSKKEPDYSPVLHVTAKTAPTLLIHGDKDELVPIEHSRKMMAALEKYKVVSKLVVIVGAAHGFSPKQNLGVVLPATLNWFEKHLAEKKDR